MCRLPISIIGKMRSFRYWRARSSFRSAIAHQENGLNHGLLTARCGHSFTIESEQSRMLILLTPAGLDGWFKEFSVPAPAMTLPPADEPEHRELQICSRSPRDTA